MEYYFTILATESNDNFRLVFRLVFSTKDNFKRENLVVDNVKSKNFESLEDIFTEVNTLLETEITPLVTHSSIHYNINYSQLSRISSKLGFEVKFDLIYRDEY